MDKPEGYLGKRLLEAQDDFDKAVAAESECLKKIQAAKKAAAKGKSLAGKEIALCIKDAQRMLGIEARSDRPWRSLGLMHLGEKWQGRWFGWYARWLPRVLPVYAAIAIGPWAGVICYVALAAADLWMGAENRSRKAKAAAESMGRMHAALGWVAKDGGGDSKRPMCAIYGANDAEVAKMPLPLDSARLGQVADSTMLALYQSKGDSMPRFAVGFPPGGMTFVTSFGYVELDDYLLADRVLRHAALKIQSLCEPMRELGPLAFELDSASKRRALMGRRMATAQSMGEQWKSVALPDDVLDAILKSVDMFASGSAAAPKGLLLYGPPGTGKTALVRNLMKTAGCSLIEASSADLKGEHIGSTSHKVKDVWDRARMEAPCILFIDECEGVFGRRGGAKSDAFGEELVQSFLSCWDGMAQDEAGVLVIGATNRRELIDEALMSRFTRSFCIPLPDEVARLRILSMEFSKAGLELPEDRQAIGRETSGMSGRDLRQLAATVASECYGGEMKMELLVSQIKSMRGKSSSAGSSATWSDIVLPEVVLDEFKMLGRELKNAEKLRELNIRPPTGALLWGPPGTGKTQLARVLANESGLAFIALSTADIKQSYLGQSGQAVREIFERARAQSPCILFIDELEIVAPSRSASSSSGMDGEIVGQLLQEMDGANTKPGSVFVMGASNHPDMIDSALLSRLERRYELPLPDDEAREAIVETLLRGKPLAFEIKQGARFVANLCEGMSGRDLRSIVEGASRAAVKRALAKSDKLDATSVAITFDDLEEAIVAKAD